MVLPVEVDFPLMVLPVEVDSPIMVLREVGVDEDGVVVLTFLLGWLHQRVALTMYNCRLKLAFLQSNTRDCS
jgi:hypothetical protein